MSKHSLMNQTDTSLFRLQARLSLWPSLPVDLPCCFVQLFIIQEIVSDHIYVFALLVEVPDFLSVETPAETEVGQHGLKGLKYLVLLL